MTTPYTDIISKLEGATGPDRELDVLIMEAIGGARRIDPYTFYGPAEKVWSFGKYEDESRAWNGPLPYVTASLDRALALVKENLPGWNVRLLDVEEQGELAILWRGKKEHASLDGANLAICLLIALFKALEAS